MNAHTRFEDLLPFYAAGQLTAAEQAEMETHLATCPDCQADLALWTAVSGEVIAASQVQVAPRAPLERALDRVHTPPVGVDLRVDPRRTHRCAPTTEIFGNPPGLLAAFQTLYQLLQVQALMIQQEMWPACAVVMAMGVLVSLLANQTGAVYFVAPLVAASSLAVLFDPENDPALELTLTTPISPWKVVLARLSVVSGYNLILALGASLVLLLIVPPGLLGTLILSWLGPMAFLSALALLLSMWIGTNRAVAVAYGLWLLQYIPFKAAGFGVVSPAWEPIVAAYQQFWRSPVLLLLLALILIGMALYSASRPDFRKIPFQLQ
jgi:hypothetical protein